MPRSLLWGFFTITANIVFVIAPKNFRDEELFHTKEELGNETMTIASTRTGTATGSLGGTITVDCTIEDVLKNVAAYDVVIFVGGSGSNIYHNNPIAHKIAQKAGIAGKIVAAICWAGVTLANAGVLNGKKATVWDSGDGTNIAILKSNGALYEARDVVIDGTIVTANGPKAAPKFGEAIKKLLCQEPPATASGAK